MFYRLPFLFSAIYYFSLLIVQIVNLLFGQGGGHQFEQEDSLNLSYNDINIFYFILQKMIHNITAFFFMLILSCIFFYQNKLYYYTPQNKQKVMIFAVIVVIIHFIVRFFLFKFANLIILPKLINATHLYHGYYDPDSYQFLYQFLLIFVYLWSSAIIAIIFYFMVKLGKRYFQTPLIDGITSSYQNFLVNDENQLNSDMITKDYRKLYAIIYSAAFCCITYGLIWNIYFPIFSSLAEIKTIIQDHYLIIFLSAILMIAFNYCFLFSVANKIIIKTYSWLPISSILTATAITLILFGIIMLFASSIILPFVFALKSMILFGLWFIISYIVLYFLSRFALKRYFV